jgi:hypothetical protein
MEHQDATTTRTSRSQQTLDQGTLIPTADHPQRLRAAQKADQRPDQQASWRRLTGSRAGLNTWHF